MEKILEFINEHAVRGACTCGLCDDSPEKPEECQPVGHTADLEFFKVSLKGEPNAKILRELIKNNHSGVFCDLDLFDGKEHSFIEIGGWIGDQSAALVLMGIGNLLGLWELFTPTTLGMPPEFSKALAGQGLLYIKSREP
ncbi:hypothetical protein KAU33_09030 [Candidatus Dependentiae bacterium]|nr:hypothetical protein [Candidatus Dependentiae bacterium]